MGALGLAAAVFALAAFGMAAVDAQEATKSPGERLVAAYPAFLDRVDGNWVVWKDGTRMALDDGKGAKPFEQLLAEPDLKDMFNWRYPEGAPAAQPPRNEDPGRARHQPFFDKMYGDCTKGEVARHLVEISWLPRKSGQKLKVTRVNGVAERLEAVSRALDELPAVFDSYIIPAAGTFNCRPIAGTTRPSAHGSGIAIDIALKGAHYWRWAKPGPDGGHAYRNSVPAEIVAIFEAHGFIWGGRWYHYDTMHFEYRPELIGTK